MNYILGIDQSTQGTKAILFDDKGVLVARSDLLHEQKISPEGWISHDPMDLYANTIQACRNVIAKA